MDKSEGAEEAMELFLELSDPAFESFATEFFYRGRTLLQQLFLNISTPAVRATQKMAPFVKKLLPSPSRKSEDTVLKLFYRTFPKLYFR